ncbi:class E sortase [Gardnerella vaginalis]|uniref:class E sortase n=1 Tax=Gardnerella vaginalis TaxID=2702 RepID=UPI0039F0C181|nr:class E sortase [Bifidobacterium sp. UMB1197]
MKRSNYMHERNETKSSGTSLIWTIAGVIGEILIAFAIVCALYIVWQMWWTGAQSEHVQFETREAVSWKNPAAGKKTKIALPQVDDPPKLQKVKYGDLVARVYIPRFGDQWERNLVEGVSLEILNRRGLARFPKTEMPGEVGNFGISGHRNGYGQPLADVDRFQKGDPIIVRTKDYWFVYKYVTHKIVKPEQSEVLDKDPLNHSKNPKKRLITLVTCEPKYSTPKFRFVSFGELEYWAKVSDGIPKELSTVDANGQVKFVNNEQQSLASRLDSLVPIMLIALVSYIIIFAAAGIAWQWPLRRQIRAGLKPKPEFSIFGGLMRLQPGILPVRIVLSALIYVILISILMQWVYPFASATIPFLREMSAYTATVY